MPDVPGYGHIPRQCARCHRLLGEDRDKPNPGKDIVATHTLCRRCYFLQRRQNLLDVQKRHPERHFDIPDESDAPPDDGEPAD